jgi:hypothetical protein
VYAGPREIVEAAIGMNIKTAREDFWAYADKYTSNERDKQLFRSIAKRYEPFNG